MPSLIAPPLTRRIDLNVGYACNIRCSFCYYLEENLRSKKPVFNLSTDECKRLINFHRKCGMEILDFTGGEPTIRQDLPELVAFARKVGFRRVCIITNGQRLANPDYCKKLIEAGVSELLFSIHAADEATHDGITRRPGSFKKLLKAMENSLSMGLRVRCNSVVTKENFHDVFERARLIKDIGVKTLNFILFNPLEEAAGKDNFISYSVAGNGFKKMIDAFQGDFSKLTLRYIPLCQMRGYEGFVQNVHQVHYDLDEWNYYQRAYVRESHLKWHGGVAVGLLLLPKSKFWLQAGWHHTKHAAIMEAHSFLSKKRTSECSQCSNSFICGGAWKQYVKNFGSEEFKAYPGKEILAPWHYMDSSQQALQFNQFAE